MDAVETQKSSEFQKGVFQILLASSLWALVYFFRKTILYGISAPLLTFLNCLVGATSLFLFFRLDFRSLWQTFIKAPRLFLLLGFVGDSVGTSLMILGLGKLDLSVALVLERLQPIFTWIFACALLGERLAKNSISWAGLALISSYFVIHPSPLEPEASTVDGMGILAILGTSICWGLSTVLGRKLVTTTPDYSQVTFLRMSIGGICLLPIVFLSPALALTFHPDVYLLLVIVLSGIFGSTLGYLFFYQGLRHVSATLSGFLELFTPLVGVILGTCFLNESLTIIQLFAVPVMLLSIWKLSNP